MPDNEMQAGWPSVASDDVGGVKYQIIKLAHGALDSATLVSTASGLPVNIVASSAGGDATAAKQDEQTVFLESIDLGISSLSALNNLVKNEDGAHSSTNAGVQMLAVRRDTPSSGVDTDGDYAALSVDSSGYLRVVNAALPAGANLIGDVALQGRVGSGLSIFRSLDLDETEEEVKGTAGVVYSIHAANTTNAIIWLKFYNATVANVSVGSTTPVLTLMVPGNNDTDGGGQIWSIAQGLDFGTAITVAATTGVADADTGAPGANALIVHVGYK